MGHVGVAHLLFPRDSAKRPTRPHAVLIGHTWPYPHRLAVASILPASSTGYLDAHCWASSRPRSLSRLLLIQLGEVSFLCQSQGSRPAPHGAMAPHGGELPQASRFRRCPKPARPLAPNNPPKSFNKNFLKLPCTGHEFSPGCDYARHLGRLGVAG